MLVLLMIALAGCGGDDDDGHGGEGSCEELSTECHDVDEGGGFVAECHDLGHNGTAAECDAMLDDCLAACRAAHDHDGGTHDDHDGGHDDHDS
ncbi:Hypothetical protein I5071_55440 [Sandaracinus amylolyticus]|nr:Hypothetical protein I5071_55440 [Sandaracinus amylolyticus]